MPTDDREQTCAAESVDVAVVFALTIEAGALADRLEQPTTYHGARLTVQRGRLGRHTMAIATSGAGGDLAAGAADALIDAHHPRWLITAGLAGGLDERLERHHLLLASSVVGPSGETLRTGLAIEPEELTRFPHVHVGRLLTWPETLRQPEQKRELGTRFASLAVDMESFAVADLCRQRRVPMLAVRVVSDPVDEQLPPDVDRLLRQTTAWARWGAAVGAVVRRPGAVKDLYRLRENALIAAEKLADLLVGVARQLDT
jgi:adenosylhomocysteine nucleosidase